MSKGLEQKVSIPVCLELSAQQFLYFTIILLHNNNDNDNDSDRDSDDNDNENNNRLNIE